MKKRLIWNDCRKNRLVTQAPAFGGSEKIDLSPASWYNKTSLKQGASERNEKTCWG